MNPLCPSSQGMSFPRHPNARSYFYFVENLLGYFCPDFEITTAVNSIS
jgi:hypothetical protein